jgi:signal transduction histidine kinase
LEQKNQALELTLQELKDTQNQLVIREKMASLGTLVGGLAHEINTPLGVVNSNSDTMVHTVERLQSLLAGGAPAQAEPPGKVRQFLENMRSLAEFNKTAAQRMIGIMASLRSFARLDRALEDEVDIHEGLASVLTLVQHQIKDRITIHTEYSPVPRLICYPSQVNQMFMNLLLNAFQAIEGKGDIYLKTYARDHGVVVEIRDTGAGIAPQNLNRVFDPGFTTKGVKVGTGLGLSIVRRILDEHDGNIEVESRVGEGSTFRVFLPLRKKTVQQAQE